MQRESKSAKFTIGSKLPNFELPATDGTTKGTLYLSDGNLSLVAFTCNHCPYVKGSEEKLIEIIKEFEGRGLRALAISSNDAIQYPEDSFERMIEKSTKMQLPYPYLYDESQEVARLFDVQCTPEFYLFDRGGILIYHGAINDSPRDPNKVTKDYLSQSISQALDGSNPNPSFVHPLGCSIKWKM